MAMIIDGGYPEKDYKTDIKIKYNGLYSKFVSVVFFRGEGRYATEWGFKIIKPYTKYSSVTTVRSLDEIYDPNDLHLLDIDKMIGDVLKTASSNVLITDEQLTLAVREVKMRRIKEQIKREKTLKYRIKRFFKS